MGGAFAIGYSADPTPGVPRLQARVAATPVIRMRTNGSVVMPLSGVIVVKHSMRILKVTDN